MSLIHEFKAQVQTQSITLRWFLQGDQCKHKIVGQYDAAGQESLWANPAEQMSEPGIPVFKQVLQSLLEKIEKGQRAAGRSVEDVLLLKKLSDDINAQLSARFSS